MAGQNKKEPGASCVTEGCSHLAQSSYKGHTVDASAPRADEGRGKLRKAPGSRKQAVIRGFPNGET